MLTTGPLVGAFEAALASATGAREAVACVEQHGGAASAARAIKLDRCQSAIVPSVTFVATANAVRHCDAEVVRRRRSRNRADDAGNAAGGAAPRPVLGPRRLPVHLNGASRDTAGIAGSPAPGASGWWKTPATRSAGTQTGSEPGRRLRARRPRLLQLPSGQDHRHGRRRGDRPTMLGLPPPCAATAATASPAEPGDFTLADLHDADGALSPGSTNCTRWLQLSRARHSVRSSACRS